MPKTTLLIPCYNEEVTIAKVVRDFKKQIPGLNVIVYDNNSTDSTVNEAKKAGAEIKYCYRQGKGHVVKQMFEEVESDIYIMVDGDDTYDASCIKRLIKPVLDHKADMTVGTRLKSFQKEEKRLLHKIGNKIILWQMHFCFPCKITDMLSGYRVMNKSVVKNLNLVSTGFSVETEMTIKTLETGYRIKEIPCPYRRRPKGSTSKLSSFSDGYSILGMILSLFRDYRPMQFFLIFSILSFAFAVGFGINVIFEYVNAKHFDNYGSMILTVFFLLLTVIFVNMGFIGSSIHASKKEILNLMHTMQKRR